MKEIKVDIIEWNGKKWRRYPDSIHTSDRRYYKCANKWLHREVWAYHNGEIPKGYHIHHKDHNTKNNEIYNLELIEAKKHLEYHAEQQTYDWKVMAKKRKAVEKARKKAINWHKSEEGRAWHREHALKTAKNLEEIEYTCQNCNKTFHKKPFGVNKYCSNNCKSAYRLKLGKDNETRKCVLCETSFTANKYTKTKTCSRSCSAKLSHINRKE